MAGLYNFRADEREISETKALVQQHYDAAQRDLPRSLAALDAIIRCGGSCDVCGV